MPTNFEFLCLLSCRWKFNSRSGHAKTPSSKSKSRARLTIPKTTNPTRRCVHQHLQLFTSQRRTVDAGPFCASSRVTTRAEPDTTCILEQLNRIIEQLNRTHPGEMKDWRLEGGIGHSEVSGLWAPAHCTFNEYLSASCLVSSTLNHHDNNLELKHPESFQKAS